MKIWQGGTTAKYSQTDNGLWEANTNEEDVIPFLREKLAYKPRPDNLQIGVYHNYSRKFKTKGYILCQKT